jgi:hypothetical protein
MSLTRPWQGVISKCCVVGYLNGLQILTLITRTKIKAVNFNMLTLCDGKRKEITKLQTKKYFDILYLSCKIVKFLHYNQTCI